MNNRRTGKIARLPKALRDVVNLMLRDGAPYAEIISKLATAAQHDGVACELPNDQNLTNWKEGGYLDWLTEQDRFEDMKAKRELALEIVRQNEGSKIHEASLQLAASQLYEVITEFDLAGVKRLLTTNPENYADIVNAITKLSKGALEVEKYRSAVNEAQAKVQQLRDKSQTLNETERNTILDEVDRILGLKK